jgi:hypothetical protein
VAITGLSWWFDGQQRRFLEQVVRAFSGFQYRTGRRDGNDGVLRMVPCRMASSNRMVGHIMRNNSENTLVTCPLITVWQTGFAPRRADLQNPSHIDTRSVHERAVDPVTGEYTSEAGNRYTVRRLMPRPFEMTIQVDVWTSNLDQKHQLSEQMLTVFFPDISIQNGDNPLDWTARTTLNMDDVQWSSRSIPIGSGGEDEIDVMTMQFKIPMWLSPPAEVTQERIINQIVTNISEGEVRADPLDFPDATNLATIVVTPGNHRVEVNATNGTLKLLGPKGGELDSEGRVYRWDSLLEQYGTMRPTVSEVRIKRDDLESEREVIGVVQFTEQPNVLAWQIDIDTLPSNTLSPLDGIIDPLRTQPEFPREGERYLLLSDISPSVAWGTLSARANDIIEFDDGAWKVAFTADNVSTVEHVLVTSGPQNGVQLRWTGTEWIVAIGGDYGPGYWRVHL